MLATLGISAQNFRLHRTDAFYPLPQDTADIVFLGNSITNLHNWSEAFGDKRVLNRGVSGAMTYELINNLPAYLEGQPKKIFIMMGTNDLGQNAKLSPEIVFANTRTVILETMSLCPNSEIYVQSILPSTAGQRTLTQIETTNKLIEDYIKGLNINRVKYLDVYSQLPDVATNANGYSYDNLHLTARAYSKWCHFLEPYIGLTTVYPAPEDVVLRDGGLKEAMGMRTTVFGALPVSNEDILVIGDEVVHSGEWGELLGNLHVKNRGWGWWYANTSLDELTKMLDPIFHDNATPSKVFIYAGTQNLNGGTVDDAMTKYKAIVDNIRQRSPRTGIYVMSVLPNENAQTNNNKYVPFNQKLKEYADATDSVTYVDVYTPMVQNNSINRNYFMAGNGGWVLGRGYAKMAEVMAKYIPGCKPIGEDSAVKVIELHKAAVRAAAVPKASTDSEVHWYTFCSLLRGNHFIAEVNGQLQGVDDATGKNVLWKFVARNDNTYDIINSETGHYISPTATYNTVIKTTDTQPSAGWTVKEASTLGMSIVTSGKVELNQTSLNGTPIYNWSKNETGNDTGDNGCQTSIREVYVPVERPTAIRNVATTFLPSNDKIYDLQGRETKASQPGIYIKDGKKIVIR